MRRVAPIIAAFALVFFCCKAFAAEPAAPELKKKIDRLRALRTALGHDAAEQAAAFKELLSLDWGNPASPETEYLDELVKTYVLAVNRLNGENRVMAGAALCQKGLPFKDLKEVELSGKIKQLIDQIGQKDRSNTEVRLVMPMFEYLLSTKDTDAVSKISGFLKILKDYTPVFEILRRFSREETIKVLCDVANDKNNKNLPMRRDAVKYLGAWGNGAPLYALRVPALLTALDTPAIAGEALTALQTICFPDYAKTAEWKNWWKGYEGKSDVEILREDFKNAYERERDKTKKEENAIRVSEWIRDWGSSAFLWAVPVLIDPLLSWDDKSVRERVIAALGGIGSAEALAPMMELLKSLKGSQVSLRNLMCDLISGIAKIGENAPEEVRLETAKFLSGYLNEIFEEILAAASEAMGQLRYAPSAPRLVEIMTNVNMQRAAMRAAEALGRMKAADRVEDMLSMLLKCVQDEKLGLESLARAILRGLRHLDIRSEDVIRNVIMAIGSKHDSLCMDAISLVGSEWVAPAALQPIRMVYDDDKRNRAVRIHALEAIAKYPLETSAEVMFHALRNPTQSMLKKAEGADKGKEKELEKAKEEVNAAYKFFEIAAKFLSEPGRVGPGHRGELLAIMKEPDNNPAGRLLSLRWIGTKELWNQEECLAPVILCLRSGTADLTEEASEILKKQPSKESFEKLISELPASCPLHKADYWMLKIAAILDHYIYISNFYDPEKPINFGTNGKEWDAWWKKNKGKIEFYTEEDDKSSKSHGK